MVTRAQLQTRTIQQAEKQKVQQLQQQNSVLSSQIAPLQADNAKLK